MILELKHSTFRWKNLKPGFRISRTFIWYWFWMIIFMSELAGLVDVILNQTFQNPVSFTQIFISFQLRLKKRRDNHWNHKFSLRSIYPIVSEFPEKMSSPGALYFLYSHQYTDIRLQGPCIPCILTNIQISDYNGLVFLVISQIYRYQTTRAHHIIGTSEQAQDLLV